MTHSSAEMLPMPPPGAKVPPEPPLPPDWKWRHGMHTLYPVRLHHLIQQRSERDTMDSFSGPGTNTYFPSQKRTGPTFSEEVYTPSNSDFSPPPLPAAPDEDGCVTLPDGSCVGTDCIHTRNLAPNVMPSNPKQFYGDKKVPLHLWPMTATVLGCMGIKEGQLKYGQDNFRGVPVEAMTYVRAALSHLFLYAEGEWAPDDSPVPHLGLALASISIIVDAHYAGSLIDNRKFPGGYQKAIEEMMPLLEKLKELHGDKNPKHYTIADAPK